MKNKFVTIVLLSLSGMLMGICLLVAINFVVQGSLAPLVEKIIVTSQQQSDQLEELSSRIKNLENKIGFLEGFVKAQAKAAAPAQAQQRPAEDFSTVYDINLDGAYFKGSEDAKVTIVNFVDFECPFCSRFHQPLNDAAASYPNDVRLVFKNFPLSFHRNAVPAAKAALAAGEQGKYVEMADLLLNNFSKLSDELYSELAAQIGLNVEKFKSDLQSKDAQFEEIIRNDFNEGRRVNVNGTPTFYINGRKTQARTLEQFKAEIDALLK